MKARDSDRKNWRDASLYSRYSYQEFTVATVATVGVIIDMEWYRQRDGFVLMGRTSFSTKIHGTAARTLAHIQTQTQNKAADRKQKT